jgi:hypothetical protein
MQVFLSIVAVTLALFAYSAGTWKELREKVATPAVIGLFLAGLAADFFGTALMISLSSGFRADPHSVAGIGALFLMFAKTVLVTLRFSRGITDPLSPMFSVTALGLWAAVYVMGFAIHG